MSEHCEHCDEGCREIVEYVSAKLGDDFTYAAMEIRDGEHLRWNND